MLVKEEAAERRRGASLVCERRRVQVTRWNAECGVCEVLERLQRFPCCKEMHSRSENQRLSCLPGR